jgi:hypothetical protein
MELVTYFMIALIAFGSCLDWPLLINIEQTDEPVDAIYWDSGRSVPPDPDPPDLESERDKDEPGNGIGGYHPSSW